MKQLFPGVLLRRERLRRNWSQKGLCRGICSVSYLSKIEQGKTEAAPEILRLLFARLDLPWYDSAEEREAGAELIERFYDALLSGDSKALESMREEFFAHEECLQNGPHALDAALMRGFMSKPQLPVDEATEPYLDRRQLALQRVLQERDEEALRLYPCAYMFLTAGFRAYKRGNYGTALEYLRESYDQAAAEGQVWLMLLSRFHMGNCYCVQANLENMHTHYRVAKRLAQALGNEVALREICYNTASAQIESGQYAEAYNYFAKLQEPRMMDLHKLAVCCEKLGKREEALDALARAERMETEYFPTSLARRMCSLVRFRLEDKDYLRSPEYGEALLSVFDECRKSLPIGYASFHLPWVLEWYTAARQYRLAYELSNEFPIKLQIK